MSSNDIIVIIGPDDNLRSTPFNVWMRGKTRPIPEMVNITVNGVRVPGVNMATDAAGETYFVPEDGIELDIMSSSDNPPPAPSPELQNLSFSHTTPPHFESPRTEPPHFMSQETFHRPEVSLKKVERNVEEPSVNNLGPAFSGMTVSHDDSDAPFKRQSPLVKLLSNPKIQTFSESLGSEHDQAIENEIKQKLEEELYYSQQYQHFDRTPQQQQHIDQNFAAFYGPTDHPAYPPQPNYTPTQQFNQSTYYNNQMDPLHTQQFYEHTDHPLYTPPQQQPTEQNTGFYTPTDHPTNPSHPPHYNKPLPPPPTEHPNHSNSTHNTSDGYTSSTKLKVFKSVIGKIKTTAEAAINYTYSTYNETLATPVITYPRSPLCDEAFKKRSKVPTSAQLKRFGLQEGENIVKFWTPYTNQIAISKIYLWNFHTKMIVSDIDGTITKTNTRGHILGSLGYEWNHSGVADLFSHLYKLGYKVVYLTARSYKVEGLTRKYLSGLNELPKGPVLFSPLDLFDSITSEMVTKNPEVEKINHLREILNPFPKGKVPFVAGFGNTKNDEFCYNTVGIPSSRIYLIDKNSEIVFTAEDAKLSKTSYLNILRDIELHFPPALLSKTLL
eukprot:TRINITY_DN7920_c0_g1_i1.p1 TRINITY_DN7920_c0_g1~~TRINITY_DN7920_c0_g1_i1.p1  ORF type:complete len:610 (-),score=119.22 TRINITY_DN7920_c0_g1_i1:41-1870(-)